MDDLIPVHPVCPVEIFSARRTALVGAALDIWHFREESAFGAARVGFEM